jgi:hypothetical protein
MQERVDMKTSRRASTVKSGVEYMWGIVTCNKIPKSGTNVSSMHTYSHGKRVKKQRGYYRLYKQT